MRRQGAGFGFVMLLVVLVIIAYVAMRNTTAIAPAAMEIQRHNAARKAGQSAAPESADAKTPSRSSSADTWTEAPPSRPNLSTMDQNTSEHTADVQNALSQPN